jgi:hypothetical protein
MSNTNWVLVQKLYIHKLKENNMERRLLNRNMDVSAEGQNKEVGKGRSGHKYKNKKKEETEVN